MKGETYNDFLIPMGFPNWKIYLPDEWYKPILQSLGYNKDGLTGLGHSLIVMVERKTGTIIYADFGRYCVPMGMGRARMHFEDPTLTVPFKAKIEGDKIQNLQAIIEWVYQAFNIHMSGGPLIYKVLNQASFKNSYNTAKRFCETGFMRYHIFGKKNSNCSRFVRSVLLDGMDPKTIDWGYRYTVITPTPVDNVFFNDRKNGYYAYENGETAHIKHRFLDHIKFYNGKRKLGYYDKVYPEREGLQWVDCQGIGAYFGYTINPSGTISLEKYDFKDVHEWTREFSPSSPVDPSKEYTIDLGKSLYDFKLIAGNTELSLLRIDKNLSTLKQRF